MSQTHKQALNAANSAILRGDHEAFLAHCTDDLAVTSVSFKNEGEIVHT